MRPVAGQRAAHPGAQQPEPRPRRPRHPARPGRRVEADGAQHDVRVLGGIDVLGDAPRPVGEIVEAQSRAEVARGPPARPDPVEEPAEVAPQAAGEQRGALLDDGLGGEDLDVPVDLVAPQRRPAVGAAAREAADPGADARDRAPRQRELAAGEVRPRQRADDLRLEHGRALRPPVRARHPGRSRPLAPHRPPGQPGRERPGAAAVVRRAPARGDGLDQQHVGVDRRLRAAAVRDVVAAALVPHRVEPVLEPRREREVGRGLRGGDRRRGERRRARHEED